jgi:hypothetical protein
MNGWLEDLKRVSYTIEDCRISSTDTVLLQIIGLLTVALLLARALKRDDCPQNLGGPVQLIDRKLRSSESRCSLTFIPALLMA